MTLRSAQALGVRSAAFARHVAQKLLSLSVGRLFVSASGERLRRRLAGPRPVAWPAVRVAMAAHAYYPELLPEILACRANLPDGTALFVTVPPDRRAQAEAALHGAADVHLFSVENRGRDIAPFLSLLDAGVLAPYDAVLKLHTKRSPQLLDGDLRRKLLFAMLCGEPNATRRTLELFEQPEVGLVGWGAAWRSAPAYWMANRARVAGLASRMGAADAMRLGFFEGSMFWFRPKSLEPLRRLHLASECFEAEAGQLDATLHHAIERSFALAAWAGGYSVRGLDGRLLVGREIGGQRAQRAPPAVTQRAPHQRAG